MNETMGQASKHEQGQALFEMALVMMLFTFIFLGILAVAPRIYVRLAVDTAAYDCATAAAQTLSAWRGVYQGREAAQETLAGFRLNPVRSAVTVVAPKWDRGQPVTCVVGYEHGPALVPFLNVLIPNLPARTEARVSLLIATFKSRW